MSLSEDSWASALKIAPTRKSISEIALFTAPAAGGTTGLYGQTPDLTSAREPPPRRQGRKRSRGTGALCEAEKARDVAAQETVWKVEADGLLLPAEKVEDEDEDEEEAVAGIPERGLLPHALREGTQEPGRSREQ
eukprot:CAMPEP_0194770574 /NCGR_PEP_ID=MMETSP0323_2-20130528/46571_1 /TAXON_ID=2866 ORGANISM="Crypthecodinium cohnii, Strain Seligo" /NCGR_SAMPLE_ID=MMETSP0323_2 /ASSEMBLY_ACC=CAM_ASM_000346 /LENGTH=134 /DNA_ID=CAMNT_0039704201 /DNA_START=418 /DNA_END=820 /DNA_ORIENTATION=+